MNRIPGNLLMKKWHGCGLLLFQVLLELHFWDFVEQKDMCFFLNLLLSDYLFAGQRCKWLQFLFDASRCSATKGHGLTPHRETDISGNPRGCPGPLRDLSLSLAIRSCGGLCTPQLGMEISSFDRFLSATFCCITYRFVHLCPYLFHSISS